jgi:hypothetical protein
MSAMRLESAYGGGLVYNLTGVLSKCGGNAPMIGWTYHPLLK